MRYEIWEAQENSSTRRAVADIYVLMRDTSCASSLHAQAQSATAIRACCRFTVGCSVTLRRSCEIVAKELWISIKENWQISKIYENINVENVVKYFYLWYSWFLKIWNLKAFKPSNFQFYKLQHVEMSTFQFTTFWTEPPFRANLLLGELPSRGLL